MNEKSETEETPDLNEMLKLGLRLREDVENSNKDVQCLQKEIQKGILLLEDATRLVSIQDIFSRNERVEEVPTPHLKCFLIPVLLGDLTSRLAIDEQNPRLDIIKIAEVYYHDYLQRISDYGIIDEDLIPKQEEEEDEDSPPEYPGSKPMSTEAMAKERDAKIANFKIKKKLQLELDKLNYILDDQSLVDDETVRGFYLKLLKKYAYETLENLNSFKMEKPILKYMNSAASKEKKVQEQPKATNRPLRPIIITKDAIQKKVFGMGYPALPVMSIEEFYEKRVEEGWFPSPETVASQQKSLQDKAMNEEEGKNEMEEEEKRKEELEESDDPVELERKRQMDEYKDEHKRGEGNRHNKG